MKHTRRPSFALIYMLALLPLVFLALTLAATLANDLFRAQREAGYRSTNATELAGLMERLREDAAHAEFAVVADDKRLVELRMRHANRSVTYEADDSRVIRSSQSEPGSTCFEWTFMKGSVRFDLEEFDSGSQVLWIRFRRRNEVRKDIAHYTELATAVLVGNRSADL